MNIHLPRLLILELTIIATAVIAYFAGHVVAQFTHIVFILAFAILLTYALLPFVNYLSRFRYVHRAAAITIVYLLLLVVLGGIVALVSVPLAHQGKELGKEYPRYSEEFRNSVPKLEDSLRQRGLDIRLDAAATDVTNRVKGSASGIASKSGHLIAEFFSTVSDIFIVFFVSIYFLYSGGHFVASMIKLAPPRRRRLLNRLVQDYDAILGGFVRGSLLIAVVVGLVVAAFSAAIGLPYWAIAGIFAGITSLVPVIGAFIGVAVPVAVAAFVHPILIPFILVFFFILNEVAHKVLYPRVVGQAVRLHALVVFFGLLIGASVAGIAGALLATPIIALAKVTLIGLRKTTGYRAA